MDISAIRLYFCILGTIMLTAMAASQLSGHYFNISDVQVSNSSYNHQALNSPLVQREGHDKEIEKFMLPVLLGFKLVGLAASTFTILKIFVLQALMASKTALLGSLLLAFKALYVYLRDKYWKTKLPQVEAYSHPGFIFPHPWSQLDWPEQYYTQSYPYPEEYQSQASSAPHPYPYMQPNESFAVRADKIKLTTPSPVSANGHHVIARITETTYDQATKL